MTAKILLFKIPDKVKQYRDPEDISVYIDNLEFDVSDTLGIIGNMIQEHRFLVLNTVRSGDYTKPYREWTGITKHHVQEQVEKFNKTLEEKIKDIPVVLLGDEKATLKSGKFVLRDIDDPRQEIARMTGLISEVLFFEGVVYSGDTFSWMKVEDYQIKKAKFPKIREQEK